MSDTKLQIVHDSILRWNQDLRVKDLPFDMELVEVRKRFILLIEIATGYCLISEQFMDELVNHYCTYVGSCEEEDMDELRHDTFELINQGIIDYDY